MSYIDRDGSLVLHAEGLLSKFGFSDGDRPDEVADWLYDNVSDDVRRWPAWRPILCRLVREHLLPALREEVEVYEIETNHNPIRAAKVNDVDVDGSDISEMPTQVTVHVPWETVIAAVRDALAEGETP